MVWSTDKPAWMGSIRPHQQHHKKFCRQCCDSPRICLVLVHDLDNFTTTCEMRQEYEKCRFETNTCTNMSHILLHFPGVYRFQLPSLFWSPHMHGGLAQASHCQTGAPAHCLVYACFSCVKVSNMLEQYTPTCQAVNCMLPIFWCWSRNDFIQAVFLTPPVLYVGLSRFLQSRARYYKDQTRLHKQTYVSLTATPVGAIPNCPVCGACTPSPPCDVSGCETCPVEQSKDQTTAKFVDQPPAAEPGHDDGARRRLLAGCPPCQQCNDSPPAPEADAGEEKGGEITNLVQSGKFSVEVLQSVLICMCENLLPTTWLRWLFVRLFRMRCLFGTPIYCMHWIYASHEQNCAIGLIRSFHIHCEVVRRGAVNCKSTFLESSKCMNRVIDTVQEWFRFAHSMFTRNVKAMQDHIAHHDFEF